jgi:hypothetical protein
MIESQTTSCACVAVDAYDCWAGRYRIHSAEHWDMNYDGSLPTLRELVDADGGPCECACHYEGEYEDC